MNFPENEKQILNFWEENKIFEKLRQKIRGKKRWSFLDGPITANNPMGVHHAWGRTYKDMYQRYKAMRGFDQRFQNGFDCQGLWVEVEVEKELGFKNKKDIENFGIDKFVEKCKSRVMKYSKIQTEQSIRLGQWMDWENSYFSMSDENNYAIWHFLKKCHKKRLLYKGRDVVPWCPRCGTAISQHEILTEEYKELTHKAVYVKLPVAGEKNTYFLAWTTTPWTLPANVALAVHPEIDYVKVRVFYGWKEEYLILAKAIYESKGKNPISALTTLNESVKGRQDELYNLSIEEKIVEEFKGKDLKGIQYEGLFDELPAVKQSLRDYKHPVILWSDVTKEEGTGIVHIAPGCGEEDFKLSKEFNLPVIDVSDDESNYLQGFGELASKFVGGGEIRQCIFENLEQKNRVFKIEDYRHRYPTCWRCKEELIFRLVNEWYIAMNPLRKSLIKAAQKIRWIPSFGLERELDWLRNMKDWLISKKRYWGLSLPIFECRCGNFEVIGSRNELKKRAVEGWREFEGHSPHRPWIDKVNLKCSKCGAIISRIPDVGNPWLDAGIVPFSAINEDNASSINKPELKNKMPSYFRDKRYWRKWFPADFISESFPGQFKNWFYAILVMSQVLEKKPPFKTLFGYASVVDERGEEMHKSKGNAVWFDEAVEKIGADVMRWLYVRQNPFNNLRFGYNVADETRRKLLLLWNSYVFYQTYKSNKSDKSDLSDNLLDKWIVSKLNGLIEKVTKFLDDINPAHAVLAIEDFFVNVLSLWYIRRSRKRFRSPENEQEKSEAEQTLYYTLLNLTKLMAPVMPFFAEKIYQDLRTEALPESVHLCDWPKKDKELVNEELEKQMDGVREIAGKVLAKRTEAGIKVRQPLQKLKIKPSSRARVEGNQKLKIKQKLLDLIKEEVNVKEIIFDDKIKEEIELDTEITQGLKEEGQVRELIRHIQAMRKKAGLTPKDRAMLFCSVDPELEKIFQKNRAILLKETRSDDIRFGIPEKEKFEQKEQLKLDKEEIFLAIKTQT